MKLSGMRIAREERRIAAWFAVALVAACASTRSTDPVDAGRGTDAGPDASAPPEDACTPRVVEAGDRCSDYVRFPCGVPPVAMREGGCYFAFESCAALCPNPD